MTALSALNSAGSSASLPESGPGEQQLRKTFSKSVGEVFYTQMLKSMRQTVGKTAYLHGGKAEDMFQQQLDQVLAEKMADRDGDRLTRELYERFANGLKSIKPDLSLMTTEATPAANSASASQSDSSEQLLQLSRESEAASQNAGMATGAEVTFPTFRK